MGQFFLQKIGCKIQLELHAK